MKNFPKLNIDFYKLYEILIAPIRTRLLLTGIELKVFNHLSEPISAEAVAQALDTHLENTRLLLDGLAASDLVYKMNGLYRNTPLTQTFLVDREPTYLGEFLSDMSSQWFEPVFNEMGEMVRQGPKPWPTPEDSVDSEELWARHALLGANYQRSGPARQMAAIVSSLPEFPSFQKMLDLGGGAGLIGLAVAAESPSMEGVLFDRPPVAEVAKGLFKDFGLEDRMTAVGGDYFIDSIGDGYDLILAIATLNFARHDIDPIMTKIHDALNPGGVFISFHDGLTHERTKPEVMVLPGLATTLRGMDMGLDQGFLAEAMLRAGFKSVRSRTVDTDFGPMDLDIARKA